MARRATNVPNVRVLPLKIGRGTIRRLFPSPRLIRRRRDPHFVNYVLSIERPARIPGATRVKDNLVKGALFLISRARSDIERIRFPPRRETRDARGARCESMRS